MKKIKKLVVVSLLGVTLLGMSPVIKADEKSDVKNQIEAVNKQLTDTTTKISNLLTDMGETEQKIKSDEEKIRIVKNNLNDQAKALQVSDSSTNLLNLILQAKSFSEVFDILNSSRLIASANNEKIDELNKLVKDTKANQISLKNQLSELQKSQADLEKSNQDLQGKLKSIEDAEARAKAEAQAKANAENMKAVQSVVNAVATTGSLPAQNSGTKQYGPNQAREAFEQITKDYNVSESEKAIWADIITVESGWKTTVWNGGGSGAYGLGQALPAGKMAFYGSDYMTNPYTQLVWMYNYVRESYGSFAGVNWYGRGWY